MERAPLKYSHEPIGGSEYNEAQGPQISFSPCKTRTPSQVSGAGETAFYTIPPCSARRQHFVSRVRRLNDNPWTYPVARLEEAETIVGGKHA